MKKIVSALTIVSMYVSVLAINWNTSYESAFNKAKSYESPLVVYFFYENDEKSALFEKIIDEGFLDILEENFIMARVDVGDPENAGILQKYNISQVPFFVLEDFETKRSEKIEAMGFEGVNILKGLDEVYTNISNIFIAAGDYDSAYSALKLIENFPENLSSKAKKTMKNIEPKLKKKIISKQKSSDNLFKADSYMKTAESNLKNKNYDKAYLYLSKVIELAPGTDLAKKAEYEKNKIKDLVDKSVILNKTDKK